MNRKPTFRTVIRNGEIVREAINVERNEPTRGGFDRPDVVDGDDGSGDDTANIKSKPFTWTSVAPVIVLACVLVYVVGKVNPNYGLLLACILLGCSIPYIGFTNRKSGLSSYSIFNPNFQRLEGQLRSKQFEAEIRHQQFDSADGDD
jgi:Uncharacterized conserved domain (SAYSvFN)